MLKTYHVRVVWKDSTKPDAAYNTSCETAKQIFNTHKDDPAVLYVRYSRLEDYTLAEHQNGPWPPERKAQP